MSNVFTQKDYQSNDGMLTDIWGPPFWHFLHIISFNYSTKPTKEQQNNFYNYFKSLENILPCKYCRINFSKNLKSTKFSKRVFKNRDSLSEWVYNLHNHINLMLGKTCKLSYQEVKNRYENYRARCNLVEDPKKCIRSVKKEKGCIDPLYGVKSKCIIEIVPKKSKKKTFKMDTRCMVKRLVT